MKPLLLLAAAGLLLSQETIPQSAQQQTQNQRLTPTATQPANGSAGKAASVLVAVEALEPQQEHRRSGFNYRRNRTRQPVAQEPVPKVGMHAILRYLKNSYQLLIAHPAILAVFVVAPNQKDIIPVLAPAGQNS